MRDCKRRARQWIAEVTKTKTRSTGGTRQKTAVPKPPSQVLYILPLWEKPSDMESVAVDCLIKAKSVCKGATELGVHRQTLIDAMGRIRCAALPVTQCERARRNQQDATRKREKGTTLPNGSKATTTFDKKSFGKKNYLKKIFFRNFWRMRNGIYTQKNTLLGKEIWFSFGHGIQIGDAKALAL